MLLLYLSQLSLVLAAREGSGENLTRKCLEHWIAAIGVDEGKNITSAK